MRSAKATIPPDAGGTVLSRPRLEDRAASILRTAVTVVRGGGGFGKTTLLRAWTEQLKERAEIVWLSLDEHDASATALCELLDTALRTGLAGFGTSARTLLDRGMDDPRRLATALENELFAWSTESARDAVLFLDDVQFIVHEPRAVELLGELLRGLPQRVHVVLASRSPLQFAPLGKLRATNRVSDVDQDDLRFTREEASVLLAGDRDAGQYFDFTEGWPMALGLAAHIVQRDGAALGAAMDRTRDSLFEFLAEEVVARLPAEVERALCLLAIPAAFDAATAQVLADIDDVDAFVRVLSGYGLYVANNDANTWRLHVLFRDFLLQRMQAARAPVLREARVRYARWLRENGRKTEGLEQLLDAGDYEEIVPYVSEALVAIEFSDRCRSFIRLLSTVPHAVMCEKPMLHRFYARALTRTGDNTTAETQLTLCYERALAIGEVLTACAAQIELGVLADRFYVLRRGRFEKSEACFLQALDLAQRPELRDVPIALYQSHWHLGMVYAARGEFDRACEHLDKAETYERSVSRHVDLLFCELAIVHGWRGDWRRALEYAEHAEDFFRSGGGEFWIGNALMQQARAHTNLRTEPARAIELARSAVACLQRERWEGDLSESYVVLGHALLTAEPPALDEAARAAHDADEVLAQFPQAVVEFENLLLKTGIALLARRAEDAKRSIDGARRSASRSGDASQSAMAEFYAGAYELAFGSEDRARAHFEACAHAFETVGDRYNAALATAALLACDARAGELQESQLRAFFHSLRRNRIEYVMRAAPQSAGVLLGWALRHESLVDDAIELLSSGGAHYIAPVVDVARDTSAPASGRIAAVGVIARIAPADARTVLGELARDPDAAVSASARAALAFLPNADVAPLYLRVVGGLRVRIGESEFDENSPRWGRRRAAELVRLLAVAGPSLTKNTVFAALWPDNPSVADTTLRVALHAVRRALQPNLEGAGDYVEYDGTTLRIRPDLIAGIDAVEAAAAERRAQVLHAQGDVEGAVQAIRDANAVFAQAPREEDASEWLRPYVRTWREAAVSAYLLLCTLERERRDAAAAIDAAERAFALDGTSEAAVCALLDALIEGGKTEAARRVFVDYRRRLAAQLDASPGPSVMERYARVASRSERPEAEDALSEREREVLALVARGLSNKQIAAELGLSTWTVNNHIAKILRKLGVESRTAAVAAVGGGWQRG